MLSSKVEQCVAVKCLVKLNKTPTECFRMLTEAYRADCMSCARVFELHKRFSDACEDVEDDERPRRPCTSKTNENVEKIEQIVRIDRRLSIRMIAEMVNIDKETVRQFCMKILTWQKFVLRWFQGFSLPSIKKIESEFVQTFWSKFKRIRIFKIKLLPVVKHGSSHMILRQNASPCTGKHHHHQKWRKHVKASPNSKPC
jgi:hypothetical protein